MWPISDPAVTGLLDFAIESFNSDVYPKYCSVAYPVFGFSGPTADPHKANTELTEILATWTDFFLKRKFVNGDSLTIADYRVAPFLFSLCQPAIEKMAGFKPSARVQKYAADFEAACGSASFMKSAGGFSIAEYLASKTPPAATAFGLKSSNVKVFGLAPSSNALSPVLL